MSLISSNRWQAVTWYRSVVGFMALVVPLSEVCTELHVFMQMCVATSRHAKLDVPPLQMCVMTMTTLLEPRQTIMRKREMPVFPPSPLGESTRG